jgi:hypothetical protein
MKSKSIALPSKKGKVRKNILLITALLLALFLIYVLLPVDTEVYLNDNSISDAIGSLHPRKIELNGISVKEQPDSTTCGITIVTVMSNYFNCTDYEVSDLLNKHNSKGTTDAAELLQLELPGREVNFISNVTNDKMIRDIHASLSRGNPIAVYFGAPNPYNKPYFDSHGSVIYGINLDSKTITIANSYGFSEEISLVDFLNRMSYAERNKYTSAQRFLWKFLAVSKNMYIIVE